ncbi:MAG: hypothetical protein ACK5NA_07970 [Enterococcus sp.]
MRPNLSFYIQKINQIVQETEAIGEKMNPSYEEVRGAIDAHTTDQLSEEHLAEIKEFFEDGTSKYKAMLQQVSTLRPPAKAMGIHKRFEKSYMKYVAGCEEMIQSITNGIDSTAFDAAEAKQDEATDKLAVSIQKMTNLLLK